MTAEPSPSGEAPGFTVVMTVKNARPWIETSVGSVLSELPGRGEFVVVDAESTDGTLTWLRGCAAQHPREFHLLVRPCSMGVGRHEGVKASAAPIVLTQVDADVRYEPGVLRRAVAELERRPRLGLLLVTGLRDADPDSTKVFAWRKEFYLRTPGYPDSNVADDVTVIRQALAAGKVDRLLVERVGEDLRAVSRAAEVERRPWHKGPGFLRLSRRRFTQGWTWRLYVRFLWATRRTLPRFVAGALLASLARLSPAP